VAARVPHASSFQVRGAEPRDVPALMRLKRLLAEGEQAGDAVRATEADWLRDGFGANSGFTAFVAENADAMAHDSVVGMATCSQRVITGWNGPILFLQDLYVEPGWRDQGIARALMGRVAALACDIGSPIIELTVRANNPAQSFYLRTGFQPLPECLTFVVGGPALAALAALDKDAFALAG
jgi:ribosomal protein S18 acetylase RimI-like enzyme